MRRSDEDFCAEVFRRKDVYLKARKKRMVKGALTALICLPLFCAAAFVSLMLAIAMAPAGGAAPPSDAGSAASVSAYVQHAQTLEITELPEQESEAMLSLLSEITRASAQIQYDRGEHGETECEYYVIIRSNGSVREIFYVSREYVSHNGEYFAVTGEQYERFSAFISKGETQ